MIEYSEYKSIVDTLQHSNQETTYSEMMAKENKVLDTMNQVIKHYRDDTIQTKQFTNMPIAFVVYRFFNIWIEIYHDILDRKENVLTALSKEDRLIYVGIMCILFSVILYYVEITQ
jgi:hypothetical protein